MRNAIDILKKGAIIPATPLALDKNRAFDEYRQRLLTQYYLNCGVGGIATAVHTTQFEIRGHGLFETVIETVSNEIKKFEIENNKTVIRVCGVCGGTEQAVSEARLAEKYGYDAALLSPGGLSGETEEYMLERTRAVAEVLPVIGFYLQPSVGGRAFTFDYWQKLCEIPNVAAIKAAPFNRYLTLDVIRAAKGRDVALYTGNDDNIVADLISGDFVGGLLGHWSVWTKKAVEIFKLCKEKKDYAALFRLADEVTDANSAFFDAKNGFKGCIAGLHEVLRRQGLLNGIWCLDPDETLSRGQKEEIDRVYKAYPHLNDDEFIKENIEKWKSRI
jgi:dihydrodipicolinate synthase/N-acetylneuraminate lyase